MSALNKPALNELVSPRPLDEFFSGYWPDKSDCFVIEGDPARLPGCLRTPELASIEALIRANAGHIAFTNGVRSSYMLPIDTRYARNLFEMGLTLSFEDVSPYIPGALAFLRQLERDLGINEGSTRMTAWVSPGENGAACHYDADDIIAIQLQGTKRFELAPVRQLRVPYGKQYSPGTAPFEDMYPQMTEGFPDWRDAQFDTVEMKPGTVLCFRRGTWHRTYASSNSMAVSIAITPPAPVDCLLEQLRAVLLQDPRWRRPLYGAWGDTQEREAAFAQAAELLQGIPEIARTISPKDLLLPTLSAEQLVASIDRDSRFQRVPDTGVAPQEDTESSSGDLQWITITIGDEHGVDQPLSSLEIPRKYLDVLHWLASRETPFDVRTLEAAFPAIPFSEHRQLLENCVRGGLLKLLRFPSLNGTAST